MALGSTSNMVNIEEAERGNIISKRTDKKLRRLEELITEKKVREERASGEGRIMFMKEMALTFKWRRWSLLWNQI